MEESLNRRQKGLVRRFLPYFRKYVWVMVFDLFCAALTTVCELTLPLLMRYVTDMGINDLGALTLQVVIRIGMLYLFLCLVDAGATFFRASIGHIMGARMETDMRTELFAHLQKLSFNYFDNMKVGQIMSRITSDLFDVTEFAHHCPEEIFMATIKIVGAFIILCGMSVPLTLIVFSVVPFMVLAAAYFNMKMRSQFRQQRSQIGEINAQVEDSLLGVRVVKSFANEGVETEKFEAGNKKFFNIKRGRYYLMGGFEATNRMFDGLMHFLVLLVGAIFMINGSVQPADLVAYMLYVGTLITSIRQLVQFAEQFQQGMTGIERFFQILDADVDIFDEPGAKPLEIKEGGVHFEHVGFSYADDGRQVLSEINLDVKPGQNVALVGPSGSGKTTLLSIMAGLDRPESGKVLLDGGDLAGMDLDAYRQKDVSVIFQAFQLFPLLTVMENVCYPMELSGVGTKAARERAKELLESVGIGEEKFRRFPANLSGGEQQRVAIARSLATGAGVLLADEPTGNLDGENSRNVVELLTRLAHEEGYCVIIVTHDPAIAEASDLVFRMADGVLEQSA